MVKGQKGAKRGHKSERLFVDLFNTNTIFRINVLTTLAETGEWRARKVGGTKKTDIEIILSNKTLTFTKTIGFSLKEAEANFNHLGRTWLDNYAKEWGMPENVKAAIQECLEKRLQSGSGFISEPHTKTIFDYFKSNANRILKYVFTKNEKNLTFLGIHDFVKDEWHIAKMDDVLDFVSNSQISVTSRGILKFGDCVSMQRKSGNGKHCKIPKDSIRHPGNQIQFKIKPLSILKEMPNSQMHHIPKR